MNFKKTYLYPGFIFLGIALLFLLILFSVNCKPEIEVLPIGDEAYPIQQLENGNYEVTQGYVIKHTAMMAEITILKAKLEECRGGK